MMRVPTEKQEEFLLKLHKEHTEDFRRIINSTIQTLFQINKCHLGYEGLMDHQGELVVHFPQNQAPRLGMPFEAHLLTPDSPTDSRHPLWKITLRDFIKSDGNRYLETSRVQVTFRKRSESMHTSAIGFHGITERFANAIHQLKRNGASPQILLTPPYPPTEYLENLIFFIQHNRKDPVLNLSLEKGLESWSPIPLQSEKEKTSIILKELESTDELIIQGPPGTGKSHLMAEVCAAKMRSGDAVCIVALTNKALMEVAEKPALHGHLVNKSVFKTNLQSHESKDIPEIESAKNLGASKGALLLTTYYKLSGWLRMNLQPQPIYDLLIIEEASQGFLATFAAFRKLAHKVIIVGDPLQLPPIYDEAASKECHPFMERFARGLEYYAANSGSRSFILNSTYRFGPSAASMTSEFYSGVLKSVHQSDPAPLVSNKYNFLLPPDGGTLMHGMNIAGKGAHPQEAIDLIVQLVLDLRRHDSTVEIAVLAPLKKTVTKLQHSIADKLDDFSGLTVETIDRIQGLTVDLTIYLLTFTNYKFAFDPNRFNVATSRARKGTIIITDPKWSVIPGIDPRVVRFLNRANHT